MQNKYLTTLFGLDNRIAVVSGASSGIGQRIAQALARAGAKVVLLGRRQHLLQQAVHDINTEVAASNAAFVVADLLQIESLKEVAQQVSSCFGSPHIVVNAAGINLRSASDPVKSTVDITLDSWDKTLKVNLSAPFFLTRALVEEMNNGGSVINIGSMQSLRAGLGDAAYGASKGGIVQLTRIMARSWGACGIRVNAILPGYFPSDMTAIVFKDKTLSAQLAESTILGKNGELSDIEGAAVFLASPASSYITGVLLPVDGGYLAK